MVELTARVLARKWEFCERYLHSMWIKLHPARYDRRSPLANARDLHKVFWRERLRTYRFIYMQRIERLLSKAEEFEKNYAWLEASKLYGKVYRMVEEEDFSRRAQIQEKLGLCFYNVALQTDKQDLLNSHVRKATKAYKAASRAFSSLSDPSCNASAIRCKALALFCALDLLDKPKEIVRKLYTVLELQKGALKTYKKSKDVAGTIAQCRDILQTIDDLLEYEEMRGKRVELVDLGLTYGEEAIQACF